MSSLQITLPQASTLSSDVVRRHALALSRQADERQRSAPPAAKDTAPDVARLAALHAVMRADLERDTGPVAPFLAVDMDHCARQLGLALQAGAGYREPAAAALMSAAAALGARWLGDERLCIDRSDVPALDAFALSEPRTPEDLREWAEGDWAARFRLASGRARAIALPTRYAIGRAIALDFSSESLRAVADAVFLPDEVEALTRFLDEERGLLAAAGLDSRRLQDRRIESLCIAADLVYGLGRMVRMATARTGDDPSAAAADAPGLYTHLREALHALAEQAQ